MIEFLVRRAFISAITLLLISLIVFTGVRMIPGDPARVLAGTEADAAGLEEIREKYGLNAPLPVQYVRWLGLAATGDLGESIRTRTSVAWMVTTKLPITIELTCLSLVVALAIAIPAGVVAAVHRNTAWDVLASGVSLCGVSVPNFWLGIMLILLVSVRLGWLPASGYVAPWEDLRRNLTTILLPCIVLGTGVAGVMMRHTRSAMLETLGADYVRTARAKSVPERLVVLKHALRNALIPVITLGAIEFGRLLSGAVLTEQIFAIPGFGKMLVDGVFNRDYAVVQGVVLVSAGLYVLLNLMADVLYFLANPRLRGS